MRPRPRQVVERDPGLAEGQFDLGAAELRFDAGASGDGDVMTAARELERQMLRDAFESAHRQDGDDLEDPQASAGRRVLGHRARIAFARVRIAYVCHWNLSVPDGVTKKIQTQVRYWREAGHDVEVFALSPGEATSAEVGRSFAYTDTRSRLTQSYALARAARAHRADLVYLRYDVFLPPVWPLARGARTVVEVNSDDRAELIEFLQWRSRRTLLYNEVNRRAILGGADGFVFITRELSRSESFASWRGVPSEIVANGIVLEDHSESPAEADGPLRAVLLGAERQPWHGVDKLVRLGELVPDMHLDVIGPSLVDVRRFYADPPPNMTVHGRMTRPEYEPFLRRTDIAFGTLALHRKNMEEAAPLKVREYLAAGVPTVIAYDDTDLDGVDAWWLLRLPNEEDNVVRAAQEIRAFAERVRGRRVPRTEVADRISAAAKERRRLAFFERVAA